MKSKLLIQLDSKLKEFIKNSVFEALNEWEKTKPTCKHKQNEKIKFKEFSKDWWEWDKCPYIKLKRLEGSAEKPKIKKSTCINNKCIMNKYLLPKWCDKYLDSIDDSKIEEWILELKELQISNKTINNITSVMSVMLRYAFKIGMIEKCPIIPRLSYEKIKRQILTNLEFSKLFCQEKDVWRDKEVKLFCLTLALTGLRKGELRALEVKDIKSRYIIISKSYSECSKEISTTKSSRTRIIPINKKLKEELINISKGKKYVFESTKHKIINSDRISREFNKSLEKIGINKQKRVKRNLTLHSLRHFANTQFVLNGIEKDIIRQVIGHTSSKMTDLYTDINLQEGRLVKKILSTQNSLLNLL